MTLPFGDSFTECCSKNVVWVSSEKGIFAAKVNSAGQGLCLSFHQGEVDSRFQLGDMVS